MRRKTRRHVMHITILSLLAFATMAAAQSAQPARQGSVFGVNLGWDPGWGTTGTVRVLGIARNLVGEWGYLRPGISPTAGEDLGAIKRSMAMIRAHHLIPICGGLAPDREFCEEGKEYPRLDGDGTMGAAARAKASLWRKIYEAGIPVYVVEVMNEVNVSDGWPAEKYAQWLHDLARELKGAYPGLKICSCGMAGSGDEYYDKMLTFKPGLKDLIDFWGMHPYGANHPPEYRPQGTSLRCYEETEAALRRHGVDPIRLMCTETGYELEMSDTGKDTKYPPIKEDNRAEYMARAYRDYYVPRATIECVAIFQLWDFPWHNWNGWDLMYHDGRPRPMYDSVAALPKSGGKDWMPVGPGRIIVHVYYQGSTIGVPRFVGYTEPGLYGGVSDDHGVLEITGVPEGEYKLHMFADGFAAVPPRAIKVGAGKPAEIEQVVARVSLVGGGFGAADQPATSGTAPGWTPFGVPKGAGEYVLDNQVTRGDERTQRITVAAGQSAGLIRYGDYSSAYPGEVFIADIYVHSENARRQPGGGPYLELALSNGRGELTSSAKVFARDFKPDGQWHRITAAIFGPARSTRVRLAFGVENASGTFRFAQPFVGEADFPLPADASVKTTGYVPPNYELNKRFFAQASIDMKQRNPDLATATATGRVLDFRGRPLFQATVATDQPLFCTLADEQGRYQLTLPADHKVRIRAFALGETPAISEPMTLAAGATRSLDLQTTPPPAPPKLVNGDFNTFHRTEPGLMTGWTSFGTTDGISESGHKRLILGAKGCEGKGMYFAQSGSNTKNGGAYQTIQAARGKRYRLSGRVYTETVGESKKPMDNNWQLGIDPTGGRDPDSSDVVWTEKTESEKKWTLVSVEAVAQTERITVFVRHEMRRANTWNLTLCDDVKLDRIP